MTVMNAKRLVGATLVVAIGVVVAAIVIAPDGRTPEGGVVAPREQAPVAAVCDIGEPGPEYIPEGWHVELDERQCISYAAPADAAHRSVPGSKQFLANVMLRQMVDGEMTDVQWLTVRPAVDAPGCHRVPVLGSSECLTPEEIRPRFAHANDARADELYIGPEMKEECWSTGGTCVVREAHVFTRTGKWYVVVSLMREEQWETRGRGDFLDIIKSMDAR